MKKPLGNGEGREGGLGEEGEEEEEPHLTPQLQDHYETEAEVLGLLVDLETRYRDFYNMYLCEVQAQKILIERVWLLTQRYLILISCVIGCRYPEVYTLSTEEALVNEYEEKLEVLRTSNNNMKRAVLELDTHCKRFYAAYDRLNKSLETPLIMGDPSHRCIQHHKIMAVDIFNYFHATVLKLKCYMHQLDPLNLESVEEYRELLKTEAQCEEFEGHLMENFVYCKCLHKRPTCPVEKLKCYHHNIANLKYVSRI
ncbi:uncharacterized protein [Drosophila pseudoobscura]|uniref:Uncharacterized protein n=1 Tax=Drosophila pseudoobscura pseudoobscura TaxID=46245 RepID=A0A6I8ULR3_DROPS|nr:uncharacterized protein LOC4818168 [Drosophila pseudoobscura]